MVPISPSSSSSILPFPFPIRGLSPLPEIRPNPYLLNGGANVADTHVDPGFPEARVGGVLDRRLEVVKLRVERDGEGAVDDVPWMKVPAPCTTFSRASLASVSAANDHISRQGGRVPHR